MSFSVELVGLAAYLAQQLGIMLAVGAESIILVGYLVAMRDGTLSVGEDKFARAVKRVLWVGLFIIITSGIAATLLHILLGQEAIILSPAFLFKWVLLALLSTLLLFGGKTSYPQYLTLGLSGGTWYALFVLHIMAPMTEWASLGTLYALWLSGFMFVWTALVFALRPQVHTVVATTKPPAPTPHPMPPVPIIKKTAPIAAPPPTPKLTPLVTFTPIPHKPLAPGPKPAPIPSLPKEVLLTVPKPLLHAAALSSELPPAAAPAPHKPATPAASVMSVPTKPHIEEKIKDPDEAPDLPAIRVMPRKPEDIATSNRASIVEFTNA